MTFKTPTVTNRFMAGLGLSARVLTWLLLLPLCAVWVLLAMAFDTIKPRQTKPA